MSNYPRTLIMISNIIFNIALDHWRPLETNFALNYNMKVVEESEIEFHFGLQPFQSYCRSLSNIRHVEGFWWKYTWPHVCRSMKRISIFIMKYMPKIYLYIKIFVKLTCIILFTKIFASPRSICQSVFLLPVNHLHVESAVANQCLQSEMCIQLLHFRKLLIQ